MLNDKSLAVPVLAAEIERVLVMGDLSKLSPDQRVSYYQRVCESTGLNPLTRPFDYIDLDGKLVLYVKREATDQIRALRGVSVFKLERESVDNLLIVTAHARDAKGREDSAIAAVPLVKEDGEWATAQSGKRYFKGNGNFKSLSPADRANAIMKAETKAKRRVTLSICGLGFLEEEEAEELRGARPAHIDEHGEHHPPKPNSEWEEELPAAAIAAEDAEFTESPASSTATPPPGYVPPAAKVNVPSHEPQGQLGSNGNGDATATLRDLVKKLTPSRQPEADILRKSIQTTQIRFKETAVKDDAELRHAVVRDLFPHTRTGSLTELETGELFGLRDWLQTQAAKDYINQLCEQLLKEKPEAK